MPDANQVHPSEPKSLHAPTVANSPTVAIFVVSFLAALGAMGAVYGLKDLLGFGVATVIALAGAAVAAFAAGKTTTPSDVKAAALLEAVSAEGAPTEPPSRFRSEPWGSLYRRAAGYEEAQRSATLAVQEVERLRRELEQKEGGAVAFVPIGAMEFEPSPTHSDDELVGGAPSMAAAPPSYGYITADAPADKAVDTAADTVDAEARAREAVAEAVAPVAKELHAIEFELDPLVRSLRSGEPGAGARRNGHPANMVDALVRTAADGIEDLAAGLMRANELAGVAERVTNRATLLALNAALEATRSGSEAFASIAEETRRLAEYAREATDTISRLSNEIEMKVGETIGAIQTTSEDAKAAVESMAAGNDAPSRAVAPETLAALEALLGRVRALRERTEAVASAPVSASAGSSAGETPIDATSTDTDSESPGLRFPDPAPAYVSLGASESEASDTPAGDDATHSHSSFGNLALEGSDPPPAEGASDAAGPGVGEPGVGDSSVGESAEPGTPAAPTVPGVSVVTKIPDWLEGLEPRDRR